MQNSYITEIKNIPFYKEHVCDLYVNDAASLKHIVYTLKTTSKVSSDDIRDFELEIEDIMKHYGFPVVNVLEKSMFDDAFFEDGETPPVLTSV